MRRPHRFSFIAGIDGIDLLPAKQILVQHLFAKAHDAIALTRGFFFLAGTVALGVVTLVVAVVAVGHAFDERGPFTAARALDRSGCRFPDGDGVLAVYVHARHAVRRGAVGNARDTNRVLDRGRLGVAIVFTNEQDRQLPNGGKVHGFVNCADTRCAFPEKRRRDLVRLPHLCR